MLRFLFIKVSIQQLGNCFNLLFKVDPNGAGCIGAMEAARFLKKSGLSDVVLSRVWDLSDPGGRGSLDKAGFFVALKLVAVAQSGRDLNMTNVHLPDLPPPKMGDKLPPVTRPPPPRSGTTTPRSGAATPTPQPIPTIQQLPPTAAPHDWTIKPVEREKYDKLFDSLQPSNNGNNGNNNTKQCASSINMYLCVGRLDTGKPCERRPDGIKITIGYIR